jgi:hypothetical protein
MGEPYRVLMRKEEPSGLPKIHGYLRWNGERWALGAMPMWRYQSLAIDGVQITGTFV